MNISSLKRNARGSAIRVFLCCVLSFVFLKNVHGRRIRERQRMSEKSTGTTTDGADCSEMILVTSCSDAFAKIKNGAKGAFGAYAADKFCTNSHWVDGKLKWSSAFFVCQTIPKKDEEGKVMTNEETGEVIAENFKKSPKGSSKTEIKCAKDTCTKFKDTEFVKAIFKTTPFVVASETCASLSWSWINFDKMKQTEETSVGAAMLSLGETSDYKPGEFNVISAKTGNLCYKGDYLWDSTGVQLATPLQHSEALPEDIYRATNKVMDMEGHAKPEPQLAIKLGIPEPDKAESGSISGWSFLPAFLGGSSAAKE